MNIIKFVSLFIVLLLMISCYGDDNKKSITPKKLDDYIAVAEKTGDSNCEVYIGLLYFKGEKGAVKDYAKAKKWFSKAAEKGNAAAMCNLGWLCFNGLGGEKNVTKALSLYKNAAVKGDAQAATNLGYVYLNGKVVKKDHKKAREWFSKAVEKGNAAAIMQLGWMYSKGMGGEKNYEKAREYYKKGADLGNSNCMAVLGTLNLWGKGGTKNFTKARDWYLKAAAKGNPASMMRLGTIYAYGYGVPQNIEKAEQWYKKGVALNHGVSISKLALLWVKNGKPNDAKKIIEQAIRKSFLLQDTYGYILFKQGEYKKSLDVLQKFSKQRPWNPIPKMYLGDVYSKLGKIKEAQKYWKEALKIFKKEEYRPAYQRHIKEINAKLKKADIKK